MVIFHRIFGADGTETEHGGGGVVLAPVAKGWLTPKCQTGLTQLLDARRFSNVKQSI
jgi:hypothetical protein